MLPKCSLNNLLLCLFCCTNICFAQQPTILSGNIEGLKDGSIVYLGRYAKGKIDSCIVSKEHFKFDVAVDQGDIFYFDYKRNGQEWASPFYVNRGSNIHFTLLKDVCQMSITGSPLAQEQHHFMQGPCSFYFQDTALDNRIKNAATNNEVTALRLQKAAVEQNRKAYYKQWVAAHRASPFSTMVLYRYMQEVHVDTLNKLYNSLLPQAKENNYLTKLMPGMFQRLKNAASFKIGKRTADFTLPDTFGEAQSFYKLSGNNYVLLDFWASWCVPCRESVPDIKALIGKYGKHNFKVIGVSADTDAAKWKNAIVKEGMAWQHLSDLKSDESGFIFEKYISELPTYVLIAPDGTVLSKPLSVDAVAIKLEELFAKAD